MNFKNFVFAGVMAAIMVSCGQSFKSQSTIKTTADSVSYVYGGYYGSRQKEVYSNFGFDTLFNFDLYFDAFYKSSDNKPLKYELDSANDRFLDEFIMLIQIYNQRLAYDTTGNVPEVSFSRPHLDSVSYLLGASDGKGFKHSFSASGLDTCGLKFGLFFEGYRDVLIGDKIRIDIDNNIEIVPAYFASIQEKQMLARFGDVKREGEEFLAKNKANSDVITTASGLQYTIITEGNGPKPVMNDLVKVHYTGTFLDGSVFDSSIQRGEPAEFCIGQVIEGWNEALQMMPVGSKWKLFVPQELAYGWQGRPRIKPYSMLIFEVELLDIIK